MFDKIDVLTYPLIAVHLGERIRAVRELRHLSQGKLAALSGVSKGTISRLEQRKGVSEVGIGKLESLAGTLHIPASVLVDPKVWESKTPRSIVSRAALEEFFDGNEVSDKDRFLLTQALDKNLTSCLEAEGWQQAYQLMKLSQKLGPNVAEFRSSVAEPPADYGSRQKSEVGRPKKRKKKVRQ